MGRTGLGNLCAPSAFLLSCLHTSPSPFLPNEASESTSELLSSVYTQISSTSASRKLVCWRVWLTAMIVGLLAWALDSHNADFFTKSCYGFALGLCLIHRQYSHTEAATVWLTYLQIVCRMAGQGKKMLRIEYFAPLRVMNMYSGIHLPQIQNTSKACNSI